MNKAFLFGANTVYADYIVKIFQITQVITSLYCEMKSYQTHGNFFLKNFYAMKKL